MIFKLKLFGVDFSLLSSLTATKKTPASWWLSSFPSIKEVARDTEIAPTAPFSSGYDKSITNTQLQSSMPSSSSFPVAETARTITTTTQLQSNSVLGRSAWNY